MAGSTYKIGDLAAMFGITVRTVRYYEELGLLKSCSRTESAQRRYGEKNIIYLKRIRQLKDYGLALGEIKEFFRLAREDRTGESCRMLLIRKYGEKIAKEQEMKAEAEARIRELRWHVKQLEDVRNFFECPGAQCAGCAYRVRCDMKI